MCLNRVPLKFITITCLFSVNHDLPDREVTPETVQYKIKRIFLSIITYHYVASCSIHPLFYSVCYTRARI